MGVGDESIPSSERPEHGSVNIPLGELPATSNNESVDATKVVDEIISKLSEALSRNDNDAAASLFLAEKGYWRDHLALTWDFRTIKGSQNIKKLLDQAKVRGIKIEVDKSSAFRSPKFGPIDAWGEVKGLSSYITFETEVGRGDGVVTLAEENGQWKLFTVYTALKELKGHEEPVRHRRPKGVTHGGDPHRKNWLERRQAEKEGIDPTVLIIGAGQGGLTAAARLKMLNVPTLMIDANERIGDN